MKRRFIYGMVVLLVLAVGFFCVKSREAAELAASWIAEKASVQLQMPIRIGAVRLESFHSAGVDAIEISDGTGKPFLQAEHASLQIDLWKMLWSSEPADAIGLVKIEKPELYLEKKQDGSWNYEELFPEMKSGKQLYKGKVAFSQGTLHFGWQGKSLLCTDVDGQVDLAGAPSDQFDLSFRQQDAEVRISGTAGGSRQNMQLDIKNADLSLYTDWLPETLLPDTLEISAGQLTSLSAVLIAADGEPWRMQGRAALKNGQAVYQGKELKDVQMLVLFTENNARIFARGQVEEQPLSVHGKIAWEDGLPVFDLLAEAADFSPERILPQIPYAGKIAFQARIQGMADSPRVTASLQAAAGEMDQYRFTDARADVRFEDGLLFVDHFQAAAFGGQISGQGQLAAESALWQLSVNFSGLDAHDLLAKQMEDFSGNLSGMLSVYGQGTDFSHAAVSGSVDAKNGQYKELAFDYARLAFGKEGSHIDLHALEAGLSGGGILTAAGTLDEQALDLSFQGHDLSLELAKLLSPQLDIAGLADFSGHVKGQLDNPRVRIEFSARDGQLFSQPFDRIQGSGAGSLNGVYLRDFQLEQGGRVVHTAHGIVGFTGNRRIDVQVDTKGARMEDLKLLWLPEEVVTGNVDNELHLTGTLDDIQAKGHIHFYEGSWRGILLTGADGWYEKKAGTTYLQNFSIQSPLLRLHLDGSIDAAEHLDLTVKADEMHLDKLDARLPYPAAGTAGFTGKVQGSINDPVFTGSLQAAGVVLNGQALEHLDGQLLYQDGNLYLQNFAVEQNGGSFKLQGRFGIRSHQMDASLDVKNADINALCAIANYKNEIIAGRLNGQIHLGGTMENPSASLQGNMEAGTLKGYPLRHMTIEAVLQDRVITLQKFYGEQGMGKVAAEGKIPLDGIMEARLSAQDIDAGLLTHLLDMKMAMQGTLNVDAQFGGTLQNPEADVSVDVEKGGVGATSFDSLTGLFNLKNGIVQVSQLLLKKGIYKASAYGIVPLKAVQSKPWEMPDDYEQIQLKVSLDQADLSILPMLSDSVDWAIGPLRGGVMITGTLAHPLINGNIRLIDGAMKWRALKNPVQNMQMDIDFKDDLMTIKNCSGVMGKGSYALTGSTLITGGGFDRYAFDLDLRDLEADSDFLKGPLNGHFSLTLGEIFGHQLPKLSGNLDLENVTISIPSLPEGESELPNMLLDIGFTAKNKVRLYSPFLYDLNIKGSAHFGGTTRHPKPAGEILVTRGTVSYLKTVFTVREGSAYFNQVDSFFPALHLEADTKLDKTKIYLWVDGPANAMKVKLGSNSDMNDTEILQLLTLRSAYQGDNRDPSLSSQLTDLLNVSLRMSFLSEVDGIIRNALKVDEFNIARDTLSQDGNSESLRNREVYNVEIGKYISDKVMLKYSRGIGYDRNKVILQYDINDHMSFTGSAADNNAYTVGFEARFRF